MRAKYDIIIVGTGISGCFSALNISKKKKILMITKADLYESDSYLAQGGVCTLKDEYDYKLFFEDTLKAGQYQNNKIALRIMINSSKEVINDLIKFGIQFTKKNSELVFTKEAAHSTARILYHNDDTGKEIMDKLLKQILKRKNIKISVNTEMLDIITKQNKCHGVILKMANRRGYKAVYSENVIIATGGIGGFYKNTTNFKHLTGDGLAVALKHNIKLKDLSYVQIHPTTLYSEKKERKFLISESVRGEGALLYNKDFKRFTNELIARDKLTKEIFKELKKEESKYVWLDMRPILNKGIDLNNRFPNIVSRCKEEGYNPYEECIPIVPAQHYFMGGIKVNNNSKSSMKNLYAVGETSCTGVHGVNRLASNSLLEALVYSKRAAQDICKKKKNRYFKINDKIKIENLNNYKKIISEKIGVDKNDI